MKKELKVVVQARIKGNMRVPKKMIKPFAGSCLIKILLEKLIKCKNIEKKNLYLSACEPELVDIGKELGIQIYDRPYASIDEDEIKKPNMRDVYDWAYNIESEYFMQINACNPLLSAETIDRSIETFQNSPYDSLFGVVQKANFFFDQDSNVISKFQGIPEHKVYFQHMGTQWVEPVYEAAHCIYIFKREFFMNNGMLRWSLSKNDPFLFEIPNEENFDIDYPWQWELAEQMYIARQSRM
jgi:CMP-N-acetylneuraminic acid synthetase